MKSFGSVCFLITLVANIFLLSQIVKREFVTPFTNQKRKKDRSGAYTVTYTDPSEWEEPELPKPKPKQKTTFKSIFDELFSDDDEVLQLSEQSDQSERSERENISATTKQRPEQVGNIEMTPIESNQNELILSDRPSKRRKEIVTINPSIEPMDEVGEKQLI